MEAAGIAPVFRIPQIDTQRISCVDAPLPCLHTACTNSALRELVTCWQRLTPHVRAAIMQLVRGRD
jgi:hypothetical protein